VDLEFDPVKRLLTLQHRGLDMADAARVFDGPCLSFPDMRRDYGENRTITLGYLDGRMVVLVWTLRGAARRIISLRKANDREIALYERRLDRD
jgi:uncharacterized protein